MVEKVPQNMRTYAKVIEEHHLIGPWVLGD